MLLKFRSFKVKFELRIWISIRGDADFFAFCRAAGRCKSHCRQKPAFSVLDSKVKNMIFCIFRTWPLHKKDILFWMAMWNVDCYHMCLLQRRLWSLTQADIEPISSLSKGYIGFLSYTRRKYYCPKWSTKEDYWWLLLNMVLNLTEIPKLRRFVNALKFSIIIISFALRAIP